METKFNSQICTTREQSERLLALGLKRETADMYYRTNGINAVTANDVIDLYEDDAIPAWSLHRLILLCKYNDDDFGTLIPREGTYDYSIESIAYRIKEGYFNKNYLV